MLTLSRKVPIYLLDEPLGSLDPVIKHEMLTVIKQCVTKDNVIIISTHLIKDIQEILEQVVFLKNDGQESILIINQIKYGNLLLIKICCVILYIRHIVLIII